MTGTWTSDITPNMKQTEPQIQVLVRCWIWQMISSVYIGCLSPVFFEGWTISSILEVFCMAILATYMLTRIFPDIQRAEEFLVRVLSK